MQIADNQSFFLGVLFVLKVGRRRTLPPLPEPLCFRQVGFFIFSTIFAHFVFPFLVIFDERVGDDEHFVHNGNNSDFMRFFCRHS